MSRKQRHSTDPHPPSRRQSSKLKTLIESVVSDEFSLAAKGLALLLDEIEVLGHPSERIKVWGTLHFLPLGSPFCCSEPGCHVPLFGKYLDRISDRVRRCMGLEQAVVVEFVSLGATLHANVELDDFFTDRTPIGPRGEIDYRDRLGRTALMRAAVRGYDSQVEELLAAGADPCVVDNCGRGILDLRPNWMIEAAIKERGRVGMERR